MLKEDGYAISIYSRDFMSVERGREGVLDGRDFDLGVLKENFPLFRTV